LGVAFGERVLMEAELPAVGGSGVSAPPVYIVDVEGL